MAMQMLGWRLSPFLLVVALVGTSCEKVPLLAPSGSSITLTATTNAVPVSGTTEIIAQIVESAGTPPHSGTRVIFTTTLGRIDPPEGSTDVNGRVVVRFVAGNVNGNATITASSGGATTGSDGALRIAIGTAAVGRVTLSATPSVISSNGGTSAIQANVLDINGNPLNAAAVTFTTSAGALSTSAATTNANGVAQTSLTTSVTATVTATVGVQSTGGTGTGGDGGNGDGNGNGNGNGGGTGTGGTSGQASASVTVNVNAIPTVSIKPTTGVLNAGQPITFTLSVQPGTNSTAQIRNVNINFGDGASETLGAVSGTDFTVQHIYSEAGTYTVRATVEDTLGSITSAATVIVVQPEPPLSVTITFTKASTGVVPAVVTFTATVIPTTATVASYIWDFGDGSSQATTSNQVTHTYSSAAVRTVTVTVTTTTGQTAQGQTAVVIP
jgi:adhesin/invasin